MGERSPAKGPRGRVWRTSAGAASYVFGSSAARPDAPPPRDPWSLRTTDTLRPGQKGTPGLVAPAGERLVCAPTGTIQPTENATRP